MKITTSVTNGSIQVAPIQTRYPDVLGREVLAEVEALDPSDGNRRVRTVYDNRGRVSVFTMESVPAENRGAK